MSIMRVEDKDNKEADVMMKKKRTVKMAKAVRKKQIKHSCKNLEVSCFLGVVGQASGECGVVCGRFVNSNTEVAGYYIFGVIHIIL
jgi:hypothetical protein